MNEYLVFRLYGPMMSWGDIAVGGERPSRIMPSRSALLGLVASALGVKRTDSEALKNLQNSLQFAVKQLSPSSLIRDFHTVQVPSVNKKCTHYSRKSELSEDRLNTIISKRDYRCDALFVVAVVLSDKAKYNLQQLKEALEKPKFTLYLGRKSCPLALPLSPFTIHANNLKNALDTEFDPISKSEKQDKFLFNAMFSHPVYYWQGELSGLDGMVHDNTITDTVWDEPDDRQLWQFRSRHQHSLTFKEDS